MSYNDITVGDLVVLGDACREQGMTILKWKALVKEFATLHDISDLDAIKLANIAMDRF